MTNLNLEKMSIILKALAHATRLEILQLLQENECCVNNLSEILNIPQSTTSQHLGVLRNSGIIYPTKKGAKTCYIINNEVAKTILSLLGNDLLGE
jgi:ArsR family transcriptional regulator, arsenate/arsenite/antimonite-responsive transcriptional repressor